MAIWGSGRRWCSDGSGSRVSRQSSTPPQSTRVEFRQMVTEPLGNFSWKEALEDVVSRQHRIGSCDEFLDFARRRLTLQEAWNDCERGDWLLCLLGSCCNPVDFTEGRRRQLARCACDCAGSSLALAQRRSELPKVVLDGVARWASRWPPSRKWKPSQIFGGAARLRVHISDLANEGLELCNLGRGDTVDGYLATAAVAACDAILAAASVVYMPPISAFRGAIASVASSAAAEGHAAAARMIANDAEAAHVYSAYNYVSRAERSRPQTENGVLKSLAVVVRQHYSVAPSFERNAWS